MKEQYISIGSTLARRFELCGEVARVSINPLEYGWDDDEIFDAYGRPSCTKVSIWHSWVDWARKSDAMLKIGSHNCNFFTIEGIARKDGQPYFLRITARHYRAYKIV